MIAGVLLAAALAAAAPAPAADTGGAAPQAETVSDAELAEQRGGFRIGTLDIRLGADIRSYAGGRLVMQTNVSWTDVATSVRHVFALDASPAATADLAAGLTGSGLTLGPGDEPVYADGGRTAFIQRTDGTIRNIVVNTASNVDLRQQIDAQIDIGGFAPLRNDLFVARIGSALASMGGLALMARRAD